MRLALLLACLAAPASAQDRHEWGAGSDGPCIVSVARCPDADCWMVRFTNRVVWSSPSGKAFTLSVPGLDVAVEVASLPQREPDTITALPSVGWMAEPPSLVVEDGSEGVIVLRPVPMG